MKIVTWNVNSLRARMERFAELVHGYHPDVVLLQETKVSEEQFPHAELAELGYRAVERSSGRWTGVAIVVREGLEVSNAVSGLPGDPLEDEARWVELTVEGIRFASVYVINGRTLEDPMYDAKLQFIAAMEARVRELAEQGTPMVIAGDMNVAPRDIDVWNPESMIGRTHVSAPEREGLRDVMDSGQLVDAHIELNGEDAVQYTWWDYRAGSFHKNLGLRIDLFLVSESLKDRLQTIGILRDLRKGQKPSDHAPLELELSPIALAGLAVSLSRALAPLLARALGLREVGVAAGREIFQPLVGLQLGKPHADRRPG